MLIANKSSDVSESCIYFFFVASPVLVERGLRLDGSSVSAEMKGVVHEAVHFHLNSLPGLARNNVARLVATLDRGDVKVGAVAAHFLEVVLVIFFCLVLVLLFHDHVLALVFSDERQLVVVLNYNLVCEFLFFRCLLIALEVLHVVLVLFESFVLVLRFVVSNFAFLSHHLVFLVVVLLV